MAGLFAAVERDLGTPNVVIHNASRRLRGPIDALNPIEVEQTLRVTALGGFFVGQAAAHAMIPRGSGSIFFTGATASVKGFAKSAAFAMGKFGLRGLAQSMARELAPQNIHVAHFVIDGAIRVSQTSQLSGEEEDRLLDPNAIAQTYADIHHQLDAPRRAKNARRRSKGRSVVAYAACSCNPFMRGSRPDKTNKNVVRRILDEHYGPTSNNDGLSWLTTLGHIKDSLWSMGPSDGDDANEIRAAGPLRMAGSGDHDISVSHIT